MAIQAPVIETTGGALSLVGIVSAGDKVIHITTAGAHNFIVAGESGSYLTSQLEGGKFYYVRVVARLGVWKARFAFEPLSAEKTDTQEFKDDMDRCTWRAPKTEAQQWYIDNLTSIKAKYQEALSGPHSVVPPEYGSDQLLP
jgi:hypothetical protein